FGALLDWEFADIGHPAEDLGYLRGSVEEVMPWETWLQAYEAAGGPRVAPEQIDFYAVWGMARLAALVAYARWLINTGATDDVQFASSSSIDLYRTLQRLLRALQRVI